MKNPTAIINYEKALLMAVQALQRKDLQASRLLITDAIAFDADAAEPQNLMGIFYELSGDESLAKKHYRAAYALDPAFKPASRNLERLVMPAWGSRRHEIDFGIKPDYN